MGVPATGQVVLVPFPFSDLTRTKMRPAVVLAEAGRDDWILCQVTSNPYGDTRSIALAAQDFSHGSLRVVSYARPAEVIYGQPEFDRGNSRPIEQVSNQ